MNKKILLIMMVCLGITMMPSFSMQAKVAESTKQSASKSIKSKNIEATKKTDKNLSNKINKKEIATNKGTMKITDKKGTLGPDISVGLLSGTTSAQVTGIQDFSVVSATGKKLAAFKAGTILTVERKGASLSLNNQSYDHTVFLKTDKNGAAFMVKGKKYRGYMKLLLTNGKSGVTVVNTLPLEEYLYGVVPSESISTWKENALKAQAVAARTYALKHMGGYASSGYDVTDNTSSQVYNGFSAETSATDKAVDSTKGEILTYQGQPIDALFHASGGGYTEDSENVWGMSIPYLRAVKEEDTPEVKSSWNKTIPLSSIGTDLSIGQLKSIKLSRLKSGPMKTSDRGVSGRVKQVVFVGSKGQKIITGNALRDMYGLRSTLFDFNIEGKNLVINGYGFGHGLGMSQWGAEAMARKHDDDKEYYKTILSHYYKGTDIKKIY